MLFHSNHAPYFGKYQERFIMSGFKRLLFGSMLALTGFFAGIQQAAFWNTEAAVNSSSVQAQLVTQADGQTAENQPPVPASYSNIIKASGKTMLPQGVIGALALLAAFAAWHFNSRQGKFPAHATSGRQISTDAKHLARKQQFLAGRTTLPVPRHLFQNPYGPEASHFSFEEQVKFAIEASMRVGRVIGVIDFQFDPQIGMQPGRTDDALQPPLDAVADAFRSCLRRTDHVQILNHREIAVFITLLAGQKDLQSIAARLQRALLPFKTYERPVLGTAIYPLHGYSAGELIATARQQSIES